VKKQIVFLLIAFAAVALNAKLTQTQKSLTIDYTIQNGDTLYTIARRHHTSIRDLLKANHLNRTSVIKVGQTLHVPLDTYTPSSPKTHKSASLPLAQKQASKPSAAGNGTVDYTVHNGDTLYTIARSHHTSINALLKANNMDRHAVIKVGQHLAVPTNTYFPTKTATKKTPVTSAHLARTAPVSATKAKATPSPKGTYAVQRGDTLFSIARKNHIVISKLMHYNHIGLADRLHVGQVLKVSARSTFVATAIPQPKSVTAPKKKKLPVGAMPSYTVKKGDTLWRIAQKHHLTLAQIRKLNKMHKKDRIHTGMVLAVGQAVQPERKIYTVKRGDTLWLIAKKNHMSTKQLRKLNGMHRKDRIHTGMVLALAKGVKLPSTASDAVMIARLKKKGVKKNDIAAVMARIKKSKKKSPNITAILAQIKREKHHKTIKTPLRIAKSKKKKKSRMSSALAMLNGGSSSHSHWSGGGSSNVVRVAKRYLGRRYVWGAVGPRTFDCSGFTQYVMRKSKGVHLPRVSRKQAYYGRYISRSHLRPGDLIFFDTSHRRRGYVNHVGIYIGNHKFIHASSARHRVVITSLDRPFYSARFKWGRRVN